MIAYHLFLILLLVLSCLFQQFIPPIAPWSDARILLVPLVVLCASVTVPPSGMLILAFLGGFLWDAQQAVVLSYGDSAVYREIPDSLGFGTSIILYGLMGLLMQGIRPLFQRGGWFASALLTGVAVFFYRWIEFLTLSFIRGGFSFHDDILRQILITSSLTMILAPLVFSMLFKVARICRYTITFDALKRRSRRPSVA